VHSKRIEQIQAGDVFFENASGHWLRCVALAAVSEDDDGYTVKASTPLGNREFHQLKYGPKLRLFQSTDSAD